MTAIKICGITNFADAAVAVEAGVDLLGFILYPQSPRYVTPEQATAVIVRLRNELGSPLPQFVGVFVNRAPAEVQLELEAIGLGLAQLHGDETPAEVMALGGRGFKALRPAALEDALASAALYADARSSVPNLLIDTFDPTAYGGTGRRADWLVAAAVAKHFPGLLLAGGLSPDNVRGAIRVVHPWGVDVSSGVEVSPGRKDHARIRAFVAAVRATDD